MDHQIFINPKIVTMKKNYFTRLDFFFGLKSGFNYSKTEKGLGFNYSVSHTFNFNQGKVYRTSSSSQIYPDNTGAEVFPIRIVHEPDELLGFNSTYDDPSDFSTNELGFMNLPNYLPPYVCLYLPHTWGNRPDLPPSGKP